MLCDVDTDECLDVDCGSHGRCEDSSDNSTVAIGSFDCICDPGWSGDFCAEDVNECASSPCQNNATCNESSIDAAVSPDAYACVCLPGFANGLCISFIDHMSFLCSK